MNFNDVTNLKDKRLNNYEFFYAVKKLVKLGITKENAIAAIQKTIKDRTKIDSIVNSVFQEYSNNIIKEDYKQNVKKLIKTILLSAAIGTTGVAVKNTVNYIKPKTTISKTIKADSNYSDTPFHDVNMNSSEEHIDSSLKAQQEKSFKMLKDSLIYKKSESESAAKIGYQLGLVSLKGEKRINYFNIQNEYLNKRITKVQAINELKNDIRKNLNSKQIENEVNSWSLLVPFKIRKRNWDNIVKNYFRNKMSDEELKKRLTDLLGNEQYADNLTKYWSDSKRLIKEKYYPKIF